MSMYAYTLLQYACQTSQAFFELLNYVTIDYDVPFLLYSILSLCQAM